MFGIRILQAQVQTQLILRPFYGQLVHVIRPRQSAMEDPFVKYVPG